MKKSKLYSGAAMALAAALCVSAASCSNGRKTSSQASGDASAASQTAAYTPKDYSKEAPLKVSFTGIAWGSAAEKNGVMEQAIEKELNLDMDISWVPYQDYSDRLNVQLISNSMTDVVQIREQGGKVFYPQIAQAIKNNVFYDLTPYIISNGFKDQNAFMKSWSDEIWENASFKGRLYALPRKTMPITANSAIIVRKDIMDAAGLKEPATMDELGDFIINMGKAGNMYGLQFSKNDFDTTEVKALATAYTGIQDWGIDGSGEFYYQAFMPEYKGFLTFMKKLYDAKAIDPEFVLGQYDNSDFTKGTSAVKMNTWWNWDQSEDGVYKKWFNKSVGDEARVWAVPAVKGPKGYSVTVTAGFETPIMISKKVPEKNMDRLIQALNKTDDNYQFLLKYGLEGTHYTMENGVPVAKTEEQKAARKSGYVGGWNMLLLVPTEDYVQTKFAAAKASEANMKQATKISEFGEQKAAEMGLKMPALTLESATYNSKWTNVTKDLTDNRAKVVMGQMTLEQWDEYVNTVVNSADYKAILKEFKAAKAEN